jgi:phospholipase C
MSTDSPIEHVVIIVKENHTFDNYFGTFAGADGMHLPPVSDPTNVNPLHNHVAWLSFATQAIREQYAEADIPAYFAYARQFTLCDHYFTDVASQSEPNHLMLIAAASPIIDNSSKKRPYQPSPPFELPSLPASLEQAGLTWRNYGGFYHQHITDLAQSTFNVASEQFDTDIATNSLPNVSWLYAPESHSHGQSGGLSEHPPEDVYKGMQWTVERVNTLGQSPYWTSTAIFITWDDFGGWYDHVAAPDVEQWTGGGPAGYSGSQFRYGPRVGCLVLSPYAKRGNVSKTMRSHVSIVRFCEKRFGLDALGERDAASDDMADCFEFAQEPAPPPNWQPAS